MKNIFTWITQQKDIDKQVIGLVIALAITGIVKDLSAGIIDPFVFGTLKVRRADVQKVGPYEFKMHLMAAGLVRTLVILFLVYQFARGMQNR